MGSLVAMFANTFLLSNNGCGGPVLKLVGPEERRKKRPHRKSRLGCIRCKRRKVKCDEGNPCKNCVKRKEICIRHSPVSSSQGDGQPSPPLMTPPYELGWSPLSEPESGPVNLLHMELLHHFEQHSIPTLPFQPVWPRMLQLAFQSRQHTYLINAVLSFAAAHLDYLLPSGSNPRYHRAKYALLNQALHDYRAALSSPITAENCDALLGTANLIQYLMWCDLSFMDGQHPTASAAAALDLSGDRLYWLSTGVRQIFFMAWPLFQSAQSVFAGVGLLQPCMVLEDVVDARGLGWQRYLRGFMELYENPRYCGGREGISSAILEVSLSKRSKTPPRPCRSSSSAPSGTTGSDARSSAYLEGLVPDFPASGTPPYKIMTLWQSYKEGEAYVNSAGAHDEGLMRAAYKRLASRVAIAMAHLVDSRGGGGCPASAMRRDGCRLPETRPSDRVRFVSTFPMMCFGPLLALISSGDSRMLVVLFHIYRLAGALLPGETYWWCKRRVAVMEEAIGLELRKRGLEVCLRRRSEVD
ncbi:hypothetical protein VTI74DRAFT_5622 [Chaetomium olivicolor]